jgi:hypothetical protein
LYELLKFPQSWLERNPVMVLVCLAALFVCLTLKMMWIWSPWSNAAKDGALFVVGGRMLMVDLWRMKGKGIPK